MASPYELRRFDTYPPIPVVLSDNSGTPAIDLTNVIAVTGVHYELKGTTAALITGVCTLGQVNVTGTATQGSAVLTSVAPTTGYSTGATIWSSGVTGSSNTIVSGVGSSSILMSGTATTAGTFTFNVNMGLVYIPLNSSGLPNGFQTADTYTGEAEIHWQNGGTQTVPNSLASDFTILVDTDLEGG